MRKNRSVFVLDDSEISLTVIRRAFQNAGINNAFYFDNDHEFRSAFSKDCGVVFLDHNLQNRVKGFDLLAFIKAASKDCNVYIISSTSNADTVAKYSAHVSRVILKKGDWLRDMIELVKRSKIRNKRQWPVVEYLKTLISLVTEYLKKTNES